MIETKDLFYIIGISSTMLIGLFNYFISIKNRRNSLRSFYIVLKLRIEYSRNNDKIKAQSLMIGLLLI